MNTCISKLPTAPESAFGRNKVNNKAQKAVFIEWYNLAYIFTDLLTDLLSRPINADSAREEYYYWKITLNEPITPEELENLFEQAQASEYDREENAYTDGFPIMELCQGVCNKLMNKLLPFSLSSTRADDDGVWFIGDADEKKQPAVNNESWPTTKTNYHYADNYDNKIVNTALTNHFTPGSEELTNEVCLVNTPGEYTGFEDMPKSVDDWFGGIGVNFTHFPNLTRLWGKERSIYAFTFRYEIAHQCDEMSNHDYPVVLSYGEQLKQLKDAAGKIAEAIPYAIVRLSERAACYEQHELEIVFPYPCVQKQILSAHDILESQFDYVWDIGREAEKPAPDANANADAKDKTPLNVFEKVLPEGSALAVRSGGDPNFPGVYIYLVQPGGVENDDLLCVAEYNSDRPSDKAICVCVYAHNLDEPTYYASYHDDGKPCGVV